jgi:hypothetical protein
VYGITGIAAPAWLGCSMDSRVRCNARLQAEDETAVVLELVLLAKDLRLRRMHLLHIRLEPRQQIAAHRTLLGARGQQVGDLVQLPLVVEQQVAARQLNRVARYLGRHKGIAVAVAADPGTEAQHLGQRVRLDLQAIGGAQRLGNLAVQAGQRLEDGDVVVVEPHLDLVVNGGPARAHLVGLPQAGDLGQHQLFQAGQVLLGDGDAIQRPETRRCAAA